MAGRDRPAPRRKQNPFRTLGIESVDWKDPAQLRRFLSDRGKIRSRRITGLDPQQQRQVATAVKYARELALLPYPAARAADLTASSGSGATACRAVRRPSPEPALRFRQDH